MNSACTSARKQVTVLGINSLYGKVVSFLLKQSPVANRLVLYDEGESGVAEDIAEIPTPCKVLFYNGEQQLGCAVKNSDVILIGDKDDSLADDNEVIRRKAAEIVRYAQAISNTAPNAIVLIAATPVNSLLPLFSEAQIDTGTYDSDRVMGVTSADTMRASTLLARHMGVEPEKAYLPVIGGSSADTRIPLFSQSRPMMKGTKNDLRNLTRVVKMTEDELKGMLNRGEALNKAYATVQLIDSVMAALHGQRNISEIVLSKTCLVPNVDYFSLPVILGPKGIAHRFPLPTLTQRESILLDHAVKHIEIDKMKGINALSGQSVTIEAPDTTEKYSELINCYEKDFVESLMEKFKIGGDCPEKREPRVEYKLLSKVKLKLPPESKPSEVPERTRFVGPDNLGDGCHPVKLPCPPIPPIRGLNQIQAKHTCKAKSKLKMCKCFFPPVEKTMVPCNLCPNTKPCASYGEFKTFHEEHRKSCLPTGFAEEEGRSLVVIPNRMLQISSGQHQAEDSGTTATSTTSDMKPEVTGFSATSSKAIFHAVEEYPKRVDADYRTPKLELRMPARAKTSEDQHHEINTVSGPKAPSQHHKPTPPIPERLLLKAGTIPNSAAINTSLTFNKEMSKPMKAPSQPRQRTLQQDDPDWSFKCSTSLCLDVLAPKTQGGTQTLKNPTENAGNTNQYKPAHANTPTIQQATLEQNMTKTQQKQRKKYNYCSGISIKTPQEMMEEIYTELKPKDETDASSKTAHNDMPEERIPYIQDGLQTDSQQAIFFKEPQDAQRNVESILECSNNLAFTGNTKYSGYSDKVKDKRRVKVSYHVPSQLEKAKDHSPGYDRDDNQTKDMKIKRRIYATLKVIDNIKPEATSLREKTNKMGFSVRRHFNEDSNEDCAKRLIKKELTSDPKNSLLEGLREKAKSINTYMELQEGARANLDKRKQRRRNDHNMGIGSLIDSINLARRLPKRLESRPALRKSYQALKKMYNRPNQLGNQGKRGSILSSPIPVSETNALIVVNDTKESKRLNGRIDRIKERIQEALKRIIFPLEKTGVEPEQRRVKHENVSHNLVARPAMRRAFKAKQEFFVEMRKMDPAYRPTTRIYAAKCPTRLLYGDDPRNHSNMVTFNNVVENESIRANTSIPKSKERILEDGSSVDQRTVSVTSLDFPQPPIFPDLILEEEKTIAKGEQNEIQPREEPERRAIDPHETRNQCQRVTKPVGPHLRGDYVKHFETNKLPQNLTTVLPESLRAVIRAHSRNVVTPGSLRAKRLNDGRYAMTSPNRLMHGKKY